MKSGIKIRAFRASIAIFMAFLNFAHSYFLARSTLATHLCTLKLYHNAILSIPYCNSRASTCLACTLIFHLMNPSHNLNCIFQCQSSSHLKFSTSACFTYSRCSYCSHHTVAGVAASLNSFFSDSDSSRNLRNFVETRLEANP